MKLWLVQMDTKLGDKKANASKMLGHLADAAKTGVDLIVFPELVLTGYFCHQRFPELAETIPGPSTMEILETVKNSNMYTVILAIAFCVVVATAAFVAYTCYTQYGTIFKIQ